jgi:hypothetical protein
MGQFPWLGLGGPLVRCENVSRGHSQLYIEEGEDSRGLGGTLGHLISIIIWAVSKSKGAGTC